ncbi:MAG TPA: fused MFS/spermidine synthase [Terriglobales bacterium]|nr:fused MFS/spermidine synthase [Terriglobales bacterium]
MRWFFGFFFVSGFCSILYELVWLRLAMAQFAVTTALISIVLSAFMIGLGLGSWGAGRYVRSWGASGSLPSLRLYAMVEFLIGISAFAVSRELSEGRFLLERVDAGHPVSLTTYYILAGLWIGLTLIPWCACMGATFPFAMAAIRERFSQPSERSFSYLYLANVLGAVAGACIPLLLIEEWGFSGTLHFGAGLNFALAASAFLLSLRQQPVPSAQTASAQAASASPQPLPPPKSVTPWPYLVLFGTGLTSMAVEVTWIRLFTPGLSTFVYAFATILGLYLGATYLGSQFYRKSKRAGQTTSGMLFACLAFSVVFPLLICDPRLPIIYHLRVLSILPFSFLVGWITPMVLDGVAQGDPDLAGRGYAINIAGCVLGPLLAGFLLLPWIGERYTLLACAIPWMLLSLVQWPAASHPSARTRARALARSAFVSVLGLILVAATNDYETRYVPREVRRDSTATVTAMGTGMDKQLLVNGVGMTGLTPITKMIAHLPLVFLDRPPKNALVICFGMGTTHRSMLSWGISSTVVELVPSVIKVFSYFHADAEQVERSPRSHIVINDGRFFLERSTDLYDVIVLDPPPPVEAAASSLLYSKEFYALARQHLRPGGILQQWIPGTGDPVIVASVAKALKESFAYVRVFRSIETSKGCHYLASNSPIPNYSAETLASHMPPSAVADFLEWDPGTTAEQKFVRVLNHELSLDDLIAGAPDAPALQDDRPVNEYFILRRMEDPVYMKKAWAELLARVGRKAES